MCCCYVFFFFFSSRRRHTRCSRDWSSDVCSSDLQRLRRAVETSGALHLKDAADLLKVSEMTVRRDLAGPRSEERRVGKGVDLGGGGSTKKKRKKKRRSWLMT